MAEFASKTNIYKYLITVIDYIEENGNNLGAGGYNPLFPIPGLDGWQLLVLIVESTTRKKIPDKVKNIVSLIGIGLLLLLMAVVVVKDVIKYIFMGMALL
jgi:hypothetical protein